MGASEKGFSIGSAFEIKYQRGMLELGKNREAEKEWEREKAEGKWVRQMKGENRKTLS